MGRYKEFRAPKRRGYDDDYHISSVQVPSTTRSVGALRPSAQGHPDRTGHHREPGAMIKGTVKWFNATKEYGFIQPQGSADKDVFVHISAVERAGLSGLTGGQIVEYEEVSKKGKTSAENLKVQL